MHDIRADEKKKKYLNTCRPKYALVCDFCSSFDSAHYMLLFLSVFSFFSFSWNIPMRVRMRVCVRLV